jgi:hypothetical protein
LRGSIYPFSGFSAFFQRPDARSATTSNDPKEETMSKAIKTLAVAFAVAAFAAPLAQADAYRSSDRGRAHAVARMNPLKMGDVSRMNPLKMTDVSRMNPWAWRGVAGHEGRAVPKGVRRMLPWASRGAPVM